MATGNDDSGRAACGRTNGPLVQAVAWMTEENLKSMTQRSYQTDPDARRRMRIWSEPPYRSHKAAIAAFQDLGIMEAEVMPDYTPAEFKTELQGILDSVGSGIRVVDLSATLPTKPNGSLLAAIKAVSSAKCATHSRDNVAFMIARTPETTPGFVHMCAYGSQLADPGARPLADSAFGCVVFHNRREFAMPARICCGPARVAAECVASMMGVGFHGFKCVYCHVPLARWGSVAGRLTQTLDPHLITDCGHVYHPSCALKMFYASYENDGADACECVVCGTPMPMSFSADANAPPPEGTVPIGPGPPAAAAAERATNGELVAAMPRAAGASATVSPAPGARLASGHRAIYNAAEMSKCFNQLGLGVSLVSTEDTNGLPERVRSRATPAE